MEEIKVPISASVMKRWREYERPSWEDDNRPNDHVYTILQRYKTRVHIKNEEELDTVMKSLNYWKTAISDMWNANKQTEQALQDVARKIESEVQ
ncbi:MAG: hypothetical protein ABEJ56_05710 [Candidatus Nanohaloarchaea archaeon]